MGLDDVAVMSKAAAKQTAGVLGDDLALNAQQVSGVDPERELPVIWAVAKGSLVNKVILVPSALAISFVAPWAITPLLMVGGGILAHGFAPLHHLSGSAAEAARGIPGAGGVLGAITPTLVGTLAGVLAGIILLVAVKLVTRMLPRKANA